MGNYWLFNLLFSTGDKYVFVLLTRFEPGSSGIRGKHSTNFIAINANLDLLLVEVT